MKHIYIIILISLFCHFPAFAEEGNLSLDRCQQMAKENYPLIRQYELIDKTVEYSLSNVKKAYLPQFNLSAQATYQSAAADFPDEFVGQGLGQFAGLQEIRQGNTVHVFHHDAGAQGLVSLHAQRVPDVGVFQWITYVELLEQQLAVKLLRGVFRLQAFQYVQPSQAPAHVQLAVSGGRHVYLLQVREPESVGWNVLSEKSR